MPQLDVTRGIKARHLFKNIKVAGKIKIFGRFMPRFYVQPRHKSSRKLQKCYHVFICLVCAWTDAYWTLEKVHSALVIKLMLLILN